MVRLLQRRAADSGTVRLICLAIHHIQRERRLPPTEERIVAHVIDRYQHLFRLNNTSEPLLTNAYIEGQIQLARVDGLIQLVRHTPVNSGGPEVSCYIVPNDLSPSTSTGGGDKTYDWYCFDCHGSGEVVACDKCRRVYHPQCLPDNSWVETKYLLCPACDLLERPLLRRLKRNAIGVGKSDNPADAAGGGGIVEDRGVINSVATIIVAKLEQTFTDLKSLDPNHSTAMLPVPQSENRDIAFERKIYDRLVFESFDLNKISRRARYQQYANLEEFRIDLQTVAHCVLVYFGKDCLQFSRKIDDLYELVRKELHMASLCPQCYRVRHEATPNWFCQPCSPTPHSLAYAPYRLHDADNDAGTNKSDTIYFPAKILRRGKQVVEVAYFGTHEQAQLPSNIAIINANDPTVICPAPPTTTVPGGGKSTTRSAAAATPTIAENWQRAIEELEQYRRKLAAFNHSQSTNHKGSNGFTLGGKRLRDELSPSSARAPFGGGMGIEVSVQCDLGDDDRDKGKGGKSSSGGPTAKEYQAKLRDALEREQAKFDKSMAHTVKKMAEEQDKAVADCKKHMQTSHEKQIADIKNKQWCKNCWKEAIYHCCWNNSYCSQDCQTKHWYSEHKKTCKRTKPQPSASTTTTQSSNSTPQQSRDGK